VQYTAFCAVEEMPDSHRRVRPGRRVQCHTLRDACTRPSSIAATFTAALDGARFTTIRHFYLQEIYLQPRQIPLEHDSCQGRHMATVGTGAASGAWISGGSLANARLASPMYECITSGCASLHFPKPPRGAWVVCRKLALDS